ncbi:MAG: FAD-binding protein, partial [Oxalobacteraceae bacterium]
IQGKVPGSDRRADTYAEWVRLYDTPDSSAREDVNGSSTGETQAALRLHVLLLAEGVPVAQISDSIRSLLSQHWRDWQMTLVVGPNEVEAARAAWHRFEDSRIEVSDRPPAESGARACNRAMAHGTCPQVGIGGHATIGGLGPTSRMWGSSLDHVEEVEVVLANSSIVRASEKENIDIFFAMKGAAAGFGIVSEFKVRTQAEPGEAVLYSYNFNGGSSADKADAFKKWQKLISDPDLSRKFASQFILTEQFGAIVTGTFFGSQQEFDSLNITARLPSKEESIIELTDWLGVVGHWTEDVALEIVGGIQSNFYAKSLAYTKDDVIPDDAVDRLFDHIDNADKGGALWFIIWDLEGGAINDVKPNATAYGHRDALFYHQAYAVNLLGKVGDKTRDFLKGVNDVITDSLPDHTKGAYAGYVDLALGEDSADLYWGGNVERLRKIKAAVDPNDVFHNPQSIRPEKKSAKLRLL